MPALHRITNACHASIKRGSTSLLDIIKHVPNDEASGQRKEQLQ